jgi:hypothetical protein
MDTARTARTALAVLEDGGWCKGSLSWLGMHCIAGAWNIGHHGTAGWIPDPGYAEPLAGKIREMFPHWREPSAMMHAPGAFRGTLAYFIADWNNDPATTIGDVRAVLEKLAAP